MGKGKSIFPFLYLFTFFTCIFEENARTRCVLFPSRIALSCFVKYWPVLLPQTARGRSVAIQITSWGNIETRCLEQRAEEQTIRVARMYAKCVLRISMRTEINGETSGPCDDTAAAVRMVRRARKLPGTFEVCECNKLPKVFRPPAGSLPRKSPNFGMSFGSKTESDLRGSVPLSLLQR